MVYNDVETAPREELRDLQSERLAETVEYAYENVDFYREALEEAYGGEVEVVTHGPHRVLDTHDGRED